jgi:hypothetical protein
VPNLEYILKDDFTLHKYNAKKLYIMVQDGYEEHERGYDFMREEDERGLVEN